MIVGREAGRFAAARAAAASLSSATRSVGYASLTVDKAETMDEVVFAETGDLQLPGACALESLNLQVDARRKRLVAAGPIVSGRRSSTLPGLVHVPTAASTTRGKIRTKRRPPANPPR